MIDKILLISPPAITFKKDRDINPLPPMGLGYLASVAEEMSKEVKIMDCIIDGLAVETEIDEDRIRVGSTYETIKETVAQYHPALVGVNCQFSRQHRIYQDMFNLVKSVSPEIITVAGGPHATVCPEAILANSNCDFLIAGEAEETFKELIISLDRGMDLSEIDGIGMKQGNKIYMHPKAGWIRDLDQIPFPAFHLMDIEKYFSQKISHGQRHHDRFMPIITSRGCPAKCTFCSAKKVWGFRFRTRSVENVIEELKILRYNYHIDEIMFEDDNLTTDPKRAKKLFKQIIDENLGFVWDTPNGVGIWSMDEEMLDLMKASGCIRVNFPVESGSQKVLDKIIKKPVKLSRVRELIDHCRKIDLDYNMYLIIGLPGEKIEDIWKTFKFAADCGCFNPWISVATPYPGSDLFTLCMENGYFSKKFSFDDLYPRSFLIQTPEWSPQTLKNTLAKGKIYLLAKKIAADPYELLRVIYRQGRKPNQLSANLYRFLQ